MQRPWSDAELQELCAMVGEGLSLKRIALELDRSAGSVAGKMEYLGLSIREARREIWHQHLSSRDEPAYTFAEMEPIALAVAALVEAGRFGGWVHPDHAVVDGQMWHIKRLPGLVGTRREQRA